MSSETVKSALRVLEILELFGELQRPLSLQEIYKRLSYPQSSTTKIAHSMVVMGYLNYNRATKTYLPTDKVTRFGSWLSAYIYGDSGYQELIGSIHETTGETVALSMQNDLFVQYVLIRTSSASYAAPPAEGSMRFLNRSTSGMALMSCMSDASVDRICRQINYYQPENPYKIDIPHLLDELIHIRQDGYYADGRRYESGVSTIAFRLGRTIHGIPIAIGLAAPHARIERDKMTLTETVRNIILRFDNIDPNVANTGLVQALESSAVFEADSAYDANLSIGYYH